jgi:alpha-1,6-mannosyltransferase
MPSARAKGRSWLAYGALAGFLAAAAVLAVGTAGGPSPRTVPSGSHGLPGWMAGPLHPLGVTLTARTCAVIFLGMCAAYVVALVTSDAIPARVGIAVIVLVHLLILVAPPLLSRDVFNYLEYGRMFALHGFDPYQHGTGFVPSDGAINYICCKKSPDPYGPGFTLLTSGLAHLGIPAAFWTLKALTTAAALLVVGLVWRCAKQLGRPPLPAALFIGLNPVALVFATGGVHNDWLMTAFVVAGVAVWLGGRQTLGVATTVAGTLVKLPAVVISPFMIMASRRRLTATAAALASGAAMVLLLIVVFGFDAPNGLRGALAQQQGHLYHRSVPHVIARAFGHTTETGLQQFSLLAVLAAVTGWQLWRVAKGADWIVASGWTTLAVLATSSWLLPWYIVWLLPAAALGDSRRLRIAALLATAYVIWARAPLVV